MAPSKYDLSCWWDVKHKKNNQINKREQKTLNFSMMSYGITSTVVGSGSILLNWKPKNGFQGSEKRNTSLSDQMTPNRSNKDKKMILARNSHKTNALNLITYVYMCISST